MMRIPVLFPLGLAVLWLVLTESLSPGHILLGLAVGFGMVLSFQKLRPVRPRPKRWHVAIRLALMVLIDIIKSNIAVGRVVLGLTGGRTVKSEFLDIPLDLRDPHGLSVLAMILTATPGTVWSGLAKDSSMLRLHVLDLQDPDAWIRTIKTRYERPLIQIFEGERSE
ncbi:Na+/H+ antiporter subunit E [Steroidobacter sp. S1-65]|uniref:Na+/H+ antiporter subunit E n=1 Tax=Steroidobacter gossypii TaxID=2805490 RepID=A0ABS1X1C8_9GAMM|nr:Na+/H+ antiporter subunit E [Steroidobacter gossypii]MBM0107045.1 Na+/H+ antiporter subunit E [Steroidobacter gossypii]